MLDYFMHDARAPHPSIHKITGTALALMIGERICDFIELQIGGNITTFGRVKKYKYAWRNLHFFVLKIF
jgi:hypothetical protein